ncbi:MAG: Exonuclease RNase T and DNA polymerase III [Parcubacteria group bacterium GW2011_GWA1_47_8]|nr:MAG: Exonuclease RNase T and DNA polymerase III [Parcubacteria group bacterium GW2011_GWA1_47_8]KKW07704.1 MAG: Exonuclease RNase T and DNA polymerase III [Parcubacteria group bacterium GW2011_GWA2_49_16]
MIVADIEASGLDYRKHSLLSIGAVELEHPERQFYGECRMWDGASIMSDSLAVNGFTREECTDPKKHTLKELMDNFLHWVEQCEDKTLAGQNVSFDRDFLNDSLARSSIGWHFSYRTLDLHSMAYMDMIKRGLPIQKKNDRTDVNSDTIFKYVGIPEEPKPHHALNGAKYEAEAFSRLLYGKNLLPEFAEFPIIHS